MILAIAIMRCLVSGIWYQVSYVRYHKSDVRYQRKQIRYQVSSIKSKVSEIWYHIYQVPAPYLVHQQCQVSGIDWRGSDWNEGGIN